MKRLDMRNPFRPKAAEKIPASTRMMLSRVRQKRFIRSRIAGWFERLKRETSRIPQGSLRIMPNVARKPGLGGWIYWGQSFMRIQEHFIHDKIAIPGTGPGILRTSLMILLHERLVQQN